MKLYAEITKTEAQDDGTIKVWGYASSASVDSDGETITADAMKAAIPDYMKFGAVREMHGKSAAGTAIEARVEDDGRTFFGAHVVDPIAVKKVQTGVYKGFSIGGRVTARDDLNKSVIKGLNLVEISLVDRPANPDAVFTCYKADGVDEGEGKPDDDADDDQDTDDADKPEAGKAKKETEKANQIAFDPAAVEKAAAALQAASQAFLALTGGMRATMEKADQPKDGKQAVSGAADGDLLQKAQKERDDALAKVDELNKRVAELESKPEAGKAVIKAAAISKAADGGGDDLGGFQGVANNDGSLNEAATLIKAAHAGLLK